MPNFLISRFFSSLPYGERTTNLGLGFLHLHPNAFTAFNFFGSVRSSESKHQKSLEGDSFTVSYLVSSCGLSPKAAIEASKTVKLVNSHRADSVLNLLQNYGFSKTQISKFVGRSPRVILAKPEKTLLPKLLFWQSIGFSHADLPQVLIANPSLVLRGLNKFIIPFYVALKSVLIDNQYVLKTIKRCGQSLFYLDVMESFLPNIKVLREFGVPQSHIAVLATKFPEVVFIKHAKFLECAKSAKEIGIDPSKSVFMVAIQILSRMKKSTWDKKLHVYETLGWTKDLTLLTFTKYPICMMMSQEKITKTMKFLVDEMGCSPLDIALNPAVLSYSLKLRIIPRWSVVKMLKSKGLVKNELGLSSIMFPSEKKFLERFIIQFEEDLPLLQKMYEAQTNHLRETQC